MYGTFRLAQLFNRPLAWDTSKVTDMMWTFKGATAFNQPGISAWDVSKRATTCTSTMNAVAARPLKWCDGLPHPESVGPNVRRSALASDVQQARDARGVEGRRRLHERRTAGQPPSRAPPPPPPPPSPRPSAPPAVPEGCTPQVCNTCSNDSDCTTEQLSTCVADPGCTGRNLQRHDYWARLRLRGGQTQMVRRQLPAEQLPSNDVHVHPVAASLAAARATAVAAAVAAAVGLGVAAAAQAFADLLPRRRPWHRRRRRRTRRPPILRRRLRTHLRRRQSPASSPIASSAEGGGRQGSRRRRARTAGPSMAGTCRASTIYRTSSCPRPRSTNGSTGTRAR